jgi:hypothetical protein
LPDGHSERLKRLRRRTWIVAVLVFAVALGASFLLRSPAETADHPSTAPADAG